MMYVGVHRGCVYDDGYAGSGRRISELLERDGRESFVVGVLAYCSIAMGPVLEDYFLKTFNAAESPQFLNIAPMSHYRGPSYKYLWEDLKYGAGVPYTLFKYEEYSSYILYHRVYAPDGLPIGVVKKKFPWAEPPPNYWYWHYRGWSSSMGVAMKAESKVRHHGKESTIFHAIAAPRGVSGTSSVLRKIVRDSGFGPAGWCKCPMESALALAPDIQRWWYHADCAPNGVISSARQLAEGRKTFFDALKQVCKGKKPHAEGWAVRRANMKRANLRGRSFRLLHAERGEASGTQSEICAATGLSASSVSELCLGKRAESGGWSLA